MNISIDSKCVSKLKAFLSMSKGINVSFIKDDGVSDITIFVIDEGIVKCRHKISSSTVKESDVFSFTIRQDALSKALNILDDLVIVLDDGKITFKNNNHKINLYAVYDDNDTSSNFVNIQDHNSNSVTKERAREIYNIFNITKVPNSYMMKIMYLDRRSSYIGKIHYIESETPEFDLSRGYDNEDTYIAVDFSFISYVKAMANMCDLDEKMIVSHDADQDNMLLSVVNTLTEDVKTQCIFDNLYEEPIWDKQEVLSTDSEFSINVSGNEICDILDVFSIPLASKADKSVDLTVDKDNSQLHFTVTDIGNQPSIASVESVINEEPQDINSNVKLIYQSILDIFSRKYSLYNVVSKSNSVVITTDKTTDIIAKYI